MEDLLKEEEFLAQKDNYNPWKGFVLFYGFAIAQLVAFNQLLKIDSTFVSIINIILFVLFVAMPFLMIFRNKKRYILSKNRVFVSVSLLMTSYFVGYTIMDVIENSIYFLFTQPVSYLIVWGILLLYGFFCSGIILLIRRIKLKKLKPQSSYL